MFSLYEKGDIPQALGMSGEWRNNMELKNVLAELKKGNIEPLKEAAAEIKSLPPLVYFVVSG